MRLLQSVLPADLKPGRKRATPGLNDSGRTSAPEDADTALAIPANSILTFRKEFPIVEINQLISQDFTGNLEISSRRPRGITGLRMTLNGGQDHGSQ